MSWADRQRPRQVARSDDAGHPSHAAARTDLAQQYVRPLADAVRPGDVFGGHDRIDVRDPSTPTCDELCHPGRQRAQKHPIALTGGLVPGDAEADE